MASEDSYQALADKLVAMLQEAKELPADCLHDRLLKSECRRGVQQALPLEAAQKAATDRQEGELPALSMHLILHILSFLPDSCKAWAGKLVCKDAYKDLEAFTTIDLASIHTPERYVSLFLLHNTNRKGTQLNFSIKLNLMTAAAEQGGLSRMQFLRQHGCQWDESLCNIAAQRGDLAMLQWLRDQERPCPWSESTCSSAACEGQLEVLQWLRAQEPPCPWDKWVCLYAAGRGHLKVLQWALSQDPPAPWTAEAGVHAAAGGHLCILQWVANRRPALSWSPAECLEAAKGYNRSKVGIWLVNSPVCDA